MRWSLCLCQGRAISALTPISTGSLEAVMETAAERYRVLQVSEHPDGKLYGGRWERDYEGRPVNYAIIPAAMVAARLRERR